MPGPELKQEPQPRHEPTFGQKVVGVHFNPSGNVVVDEYKKSGYPITTEILKFTDDGVEAVGKYPVK